jgi:outer membrane protein OmpA-like peptidoglycan-associated protein
VRGFFKTASAIATACALGGCAAAPVRVAALDEMERVRTGPSAFEGARLAPEAYARAEQERDLARRAHASSDDLGAVLHAERAFAAYGHALSIARLAHATAELADAQKALDDATIQEQALDASRARLDREADELQQRLRVARERVLPAASAPATPEREAARSLAARSLGVEARLLCSAARLIAADAPGLADADHEVAALDEAAKTPHPTAAAAAAPATPRGRDLIDDAARARAHCLDVLTRARRGAGYDTGSADALLAELSAAGGWDPARDERGVVVTLRDIFRGAEPIELTAAAAAKLQELGRVAAAHPLFRVQVVVHDARAPAASETVDAKRADAAVQALLHGGVDPPHVKAELAGALAPIVDPNDTKARGRNERLEIVFVGSGR